MIKSKLRSRNNGVASVEDDKISNKSTISHFFPKPCEIEAQNTETTNRKRRIKSITNKSNETGDNIFQIVNEPNETVKKTNNFSGNKGIVVPISKFFQPNDDDCSIVTDFETPKKQKRIVQTTKLKNELPKRKTRKKSSITNKKSNQLINEHFFTKESTEPLDLLSHVTENEQTKEKNDNNKISKKTNFNNINTFLVQKHSFKHKWNARNTALTRRNPQIQLKKLNKAVEQILLTNSTLHKKHENISPYFLESDLLQRCRNSNNLIFLLNSTANTAELKQFYVNNNLFEISTTKCGILLKDWSKIPGRPSSPDSSAGFIIQSSSNNSSPMNNLEKSIVDKNNISDGEIIDKLREVVELEPFQDTAPIITTTTINKEVINQQIPELHSENIEISEMLTSNYALKSYRNNRPTSPDMFGDDGDDDDEENANKSIEQTPKHSWSCKLSISGGCVSPSISPSSHTSFIDDYDKVSDSTYNSLSSAPSKHSVSSSPVSTISLPSKPNVEKTKEDLLIELYQTGEIFNVNLDNIQTNILHDINVNDTTHEIYLNESKSGNISNDQYKDCGLDKEGSPSPISYKCDTFHSSQPDNTFFLQNANTTTDAIEFSFDNVDNGDDSNVKIPSPIVIESSDDDVDDKKCVTQIFVEALNITQRINEILDHTLNDCPLEIINNDDDSSSSDNNEMLNESIRQLIEKDDEINKSESFASINEPHKQSPISPPSLNSNNSLDFEIKHMDKTYQVKTGRNVTPKPNYETMSSPERCVQLQRFGLNQLPRKLAVICLNHIYNQMHPYIECQNNTEQPQFQ